MTNPAPAPAAFQAPAANDPTAGSVLLPLDEATTGDEDEPALNPAVAAPALHKKLAPSAPAAPGTVAPVASATLPAASAPAALNDPVDDEEKARQQALRNQAATNKFLRGQDAQMETTPTGQTRQATDNAGNPLFKGKVLDPARQLDDGRFYRVSRDEQNNEHYFDLLQGAEGQDYHTDRNTGEQYTTDQGVDGTSRRVVIGQDPWVPAKNQVASTLAGHRSDVEDLQTTIDQAEQGMNGSPSLRALRQTADQSARVLAPAQRIVDATHAFLRDNPQVTALPQADLDAYNAAQAKLGAGDDERQALQDQIDQRQATIDDARQRHTAATARVNDARQVASLLNSGDRGQRQGIINDLLALSGGGTLNAKRLARFQAAGLVDGDGSPTELGATSWKL